MKRYEQLIHTFYHDRSHIGSRLYRAIAYLNAGELDSAKDELLDTFRYTERTQAAFDELSMLVGVLLEELREVDETASATSIQSSTQAEDIMLGLMEHLSADEDIPY